MTWAEKSDDYYLNRGKQDFADSQSTREEKSIHYDLNRAYEDLLDFQCSQREKTNDFPLDLMFAGLSTAKPTRGEKPTGSHLNPCCETRAFIPSRRTDGHQHYL